MPSSSDARAAPVVRLRYFHPIVFLLVICYKDCFYPSLEQHPDPYRRVIFPRNPPRRDLHKSFSPPDSIALTCNPCSISILARA